MKDEDLLKCPLLQGLDAMHRAELIGLLEDSSLRERMEDCLARLKSGETAQPAKATANQPRDFEKEVHSWNPAVATWNRSPKE